jgi:hypothetical protein
MSFDGGGSLQAVLMRATLLGPTGAPAVGLKNCFVTEALIGVDLTPNYNKQTTVSQLNGRGEVCLTYSPPQTFQYLQVDNLQVCTPDPELVEFLAGGVVLVDEDTDMSVGYGFPRIGSNPKPSGVGLEFWSLDIRGGAPVGYYHWLAGRCNMIFAKNLKLNGKDPSIVELEGNGTENPNWLGGPKRDWDWPVSDRALHWVQEPALPAYTLGYSEVLTP